MGNKLINPRLMEMTAKAMGAISIVDDEMRLKGIITEGDLRRGLQRHPDLLDLPVEEIMTKNPVTTQSETLAFDALKLMENRPSQIYVLPVVDGRGLSIGILRLHDLVKAGL